MGAAYGLKRKIDRAKKTESIIKIEHRNVRISETEHTKREKGHLRNTYCNFTKSDIYAWTTPSNGIIFVAMNTNESFQTIIVSDLLSEKFTLKCSPVWSYDTSLTHKTLSLSPPPLFSSALTDSVTSEEASQCKIQTARMQQGNISAEWQVNCDKKKVTPKNTSYKFAENELSNNRYIYYSNTK